MNQNYLREDRLLNYSARIFREEKSFLNPLALGLRGWKLDVECWKFGSRPEIGWYLVMKKTK
jgi:hypothetical protein